MSEEITFSVPLIDDHFFVGNITEGQTVLVSPKVLPDCLKSNHPLPAKIIYVNGQRGWFKLRFETKRGAIEETFKYVSAERIASK